MVTDHQEDVMTPPEGVAYQQADYAGLVRRIAAGGIDFVVILFLPAILALPFSGLLERLPRLAFLWWLGIAWLYLVVLKRSRLRTLGYRMTGVKIVDLHGGRPKLWRLTLRSLFAFCGPLAPVLDFLWISGNPQKRALRDLLGQTYVVRNNAQPVGRVPLRYHTYDIWTYNSIVLEPV
jgi:uncharacterized RDD family membrane protein YckC